MYKADQDQKLTQETQDVKPGSKVVGNPAKLVRDDDEVVEKENAKVLKDMQNGTWLREKYA